MCILRRSAALICLPLCFSLSFSREKHIELATVQLTVHFQAYIISHVYMNITPELFTVGATDTIA